MLHYAVRFHRQLDVAKASEQYGRTPNDSAVGQAYQIRAGSDEVRHLLETRLLTGEPLVDTANHVGLPLNAVEAYEALFFAVRDRLLARDYIVRRALGWVPGSDPSEEAITRAFAYFGGPLLLDAILAAGCASERGLEFSPQLDTAAGRQQMRVRLTMMLATEPISAALTREIGRMAALIRQLEAEAAAMQAANSAHAAIVDSLTTASSVDPAPATPVNTETATTAPNSGQTTADLAESEAA